MIKSLWGLKWSPLQHWLKKSEQTEQLALQVPECTEAVSSSFLASCGRPTCSSWGFSAVLALTEVLPDLMPQPLFTDTTAFRLQLPVPPHCWGEPCVPTKALEPTPPGSRHSFHLRWGRERHFPKNLSRPMWAPQSELTSDFKWKSCWRLAQIPWLAACQVLRDYFYHYLFIKINCLGAGPQTDRI